MEDIFALISVFSTLMFFAIWEGVPIFVCFIMAKKLEMPRIWCLLGLFGMFGFVLLVIIAYANRGKRMHTDYQGGDVDYQRNYENNTEYHGTETHWHNVADEMKKKDDYLANNIANWQPANDCKKNDDVVYVNGERMEREYIVCKSCGGKMQKGTNFCTYCGKDL